ncbi:MAG TPA: efflux RND transporter periplasmic adaptor subunit [Armatimonadota bacterium]
MKRKLTNWKYAVPAVILIVCIVVFSARRAHKPMPNFQTAVVSRGTVLSSVSGNGVLEPVTTVEVKSNVGGQVIELAVDEGDHVKAGQLIARIDPSDSISTLDQAKADYMSAKSKVDQARQTLSMQRLQSVANIAGAEQGLESARQKHGQAQQEASIQPRLTKEAIRQAQSSLESSVATLNQTKSALVPQKLASAKAAYDEAKAANVKAEKSLARERALLDKGFVSKSDVDSAEAEYLSSKAQLESARSTLDTVKDDADQDIKNAEAKVSQARAALETARANAVQDTLKIKELAASRAAMKQAVATLESSRASAYENQIKSEDILQAEASLQKAKASVINAQTQVNYTTVVAPRDGVVVKKYVEKGSIVTAGRQAMAGSGSGVTLVDIADISRMRVLVDVDESDIGRIKLGQKVDVTVEASKGEIFPGKVTKIAPQATVTSNVTTVPVTVELEHAGPQLKPTMNATCTFIVDQKENVLYVPVEAITETDSGKEITVIENGKPVVRQVEVGLTGDDYCEIVSNLKEGDTVVLVEDDTTTQKSSNRGPGGPGGPGGGGPPPM